MTIDEAIAYSEDMARQNEEIYESYCQHGEEKEGYELHGEYAERFRQLAEWLRELKAYREILTHVDDIIASEYGCVIIEGYGDVVDHMNEVFEAFTSDYMKSSSKPSGIQFDDIVEDAISRKELINELKLGYWDENLQSAKDDPCVIDAMIDWCIRTIKSQPTMTSTRPHGEWIICRDDNDYCYCQNCKHKFDVDHLKFSWDTYDFPPSCPNCGADMKEVNADDIRRDNSNL